MPSRACDAWKTGKMAAQQVSQEAKGPGRSQRLLGSWDFEFPQMQGMDQTLQIRMSPAEP